MENGQLVAALFITVVTCFYPLLHPISVKHAALYSEHSHHVPLALSSWIYTLLMPVLYGLITAAQILYMLTVPISGIDVSTTYTTVFALYVVNVALFHYWRMLFFRQHKIGCALFFSLLLFGTSLSVVIFYAVDDPWLEFGLYMPYVAFLFYAMILNACWLIFGRKPGCAQPPSPLQPQQQQTKVYYGN